MISSVSGSSVNSNFNFKIEGQQSSSVIAKRIHNATRTPYQNLCKAFKHIALAIIKAPIALFRSAILAMRCKKGPFLEKWSWKTVKAHFHQVKVLLKPQKPAEKTPPVDVPVLTPTPVKVEKVKKDPDVRLERRAEKALEGCMESTGKGCHGSQFVKSLKGKKIGVFKAIPEKRGLYNIFSQKAYLNQEPMAEAVAERASYLFAKELKNPYLTVPPVKIMELNGKLGSFAVFEKGTPAEDIIDEVDNKPDYSEKELNIFQCFTLFDYLLGNLDRSLENWLLGWAKKIEAINPIDNAHAFPKQMPNRWRNFNAAKNVYKWKVLRLASFPFTQEMRNFIDETIREDNLQKIVRVINEDEQIKSYYPNGYLIGESLKDFNRRTAVLKGLLKKDNLCPKDLAEH